MESLNSEAVEERLDFIAKEILNEEGMAKYKSFIEALNFKAAFEYLLIVLDCLVLSEKISDDKAIKMYDKFPFSSELIEAVRNKCLINLQ